MSNVIIIHTVTLSSDLLLSTMPANKSSPVYQHFKFPDGRDKDKFRAICVHCNVEMKGDKRSPTNLKNHMSVSIFVTLFPRHF